MALSQSLLLLLLFKTKKSPLSFESSVFKGLTTISNQISTTHSGGLCRRRYCVPLSLSRARPSSSSSPNFDDDAQRRRRCWFHDTAGERRRRDRDDDAKHTPPLSLSLSLSLQASRVVFPDGRKRFEKALFPSLWTSTVLLLLPSLRREQHTTREQTHAFSLSLSLSLKKTKRDLIKESSPKRKRKKTSPMKKP